MQLQYVFLVLVLGIIGVLHVLEFIESFVNKIMYLNTKKKITKIYKETTKQQNKRRKSRCLFWFFSFEHAKVRHQDNRKCST